MNELIEIIALRDILPTMKEKFEMISKKYPEDVFLNEIKNGYKNPYIVSKIVKYRLSFLEGGCK